MDSMNTIGEPAAEFQLSDMSGQVYLLNDFRGRLIVLVFWSAGCEWCERIDREMKTYIENWSDKVKVLWIASNANESYARIDQVASERKLVPILLDTNQRVADLYGAHTTPHFFIVDSGGKLAYHGAWNDITLRQKVAAQVYVPSVVEALMAGEQHRVTQTQPYGGALVRFTVRSD